MAKKMYVAAALILVAALTLFGAPAEAKVMQFDHFSIDVPAGWEMQEYRENFTVGFTAPDKSAALTVSVFDSEGMSLEECAKSLMEELKGGNLKKEKHAYTFEFKNQNGVGCRALVAASEMIVCVTMIGEHGAFDAMVSSLEVF